MTNIQNRLEEITKQEKALAAEKNKLLAESKDADLDLVKKLCKQHGFTATQLRGCLATKGRKKSTVDGLDKTTTRKTGRPRKSTGAQKVDKR